VDGGPEFKTDVQQLAEFYNFGYVKISPYNSKAAGSVEVGHRVIADALSKIT
ncbi:hypothetical protein K402DRAFT_302423, partial [Aulographum hederae CBS 113979]